MNVAVKQTCPQTPSENFSRKSIRETMKEASIPGYVSMSMEKLLEENPNGVKLFASTEDEPFGILISLELYQLMVFMMQQNSAKRDSVALSTEKHGIARPDDLTIAQVFPPTQSSD